MVFLCSRLKTDCRNTYHLHTKTCFSLFDSFDFLRSGWFSFLFKGELAIFKTPSICDVLNFALSFPVTITSAAMCCSAHRSTSRGINFLPCPYFYLALRASCGKLRFPKKSRCPFGQRVRRPRKNGLRLTVIFNMADDMAY